jgi:hypothetical protein
MSQLCIACGNLTNPGGLVNELNFTRTLFLRMPDPKNRGSFHSKKSQSRHFWLILGHFRQKCPHRKDSNLVDSKPFRTNHLARCGLHFIGLNGPPPIGVLACLPAKDASDLAQILKKTFKPVAPSRPR